MRTPFFVLTCFIASALTACPGVDEESDPVINMFSPSRTVVAAGDTVALRWDVSNTESLNVSASPGGDLIVGSRFASGVVDSAAIESDTLFTLTARGPGRARTITRSTMVIVSRVVIDTFEAEPEAIRFGDTTTLSWELSGATEVRIWAGAVEIHTATPDQLERGQWTSAPINDVSTVFTLIASSDDDTQTEELTVRVVEAPRITAFRVTPYAFTGNYADAEVSWTVVDAMELTLKMNGIEAASFGPTGGEGRSSWSIDETTRFELVASNVAGTASAIAVAAVAQTEVEPNDTFDTSSSFSRGAAAGTIGAGDVDVFELEVPELGYVSARVSDGGEGCDFDTIIRFYDERGIELGSNDDSDGACSKIDPVIDAFARRLSRGRYYLTVEAKGGETGPYFVVATANGPAR